MIRQLHITDLIVTIDKHEDTQVSWLFLVSNEFHAHYLIALRCEIECADTISNDLASEIHSVFLLVLLSLRDGIELEM